MSAATVLHETHFVILHDGVGKWRKGNVVASSAIKVPATEIERLLVAKAIRPATTAEIGLGHVDLVGETANGSYTQMLADRDRDIARLTSRCATLEEQLAVGKSYDPSVAGNLNHAGLIEEKDRNIAQLHSQLGHLQSQLGSVNLQLVEVERQKRDALRDLAEARQALEAHNADTALALEKAADAARPAEVVADAAAELPDLDHAEEVVAPPAAPAPALAPDAADGKVVKNEVKVAFAKPESAKSEKGEKGDKKAAKGDKNAAKNAAPEKHAGQPDGRSLTTIAVQNAE